MDDFQSLKSGFLSYLSQPDEGVPYSKNTIRSYFVAIDSFLSFLQENDINSMIDVTDTWIRAYVKKLTNNSLKPSSIKNKLSAMHLLWEFAFDFPTDQINPVSRYIESSKKKRRGGRAPKRLIPVLYQHEIDLLFDAILANNRSVSVRDLAIVGLILDSGLRSTELCDITIKQLQDMLIMGKLVVIGKGDKERSIKVLTAYRQFVERYLATLKERNASDFAFVTIQRTQLSQRVLHQMVSHYLDNARIVKPQMGGHLLRHTAASLMLASGMNIKQVQDNMGHSSMMTTERYLHLL